MDTIQRVYELAREYDLSIYQLAQKSGISASTVLTTKKRGGQLTVDTIERICMGLNISMSRFFEDRPAI